MVGIAGVQGNGQTELVEALTGLRHAAGGTVTFLGKDITRASARQRHQLGMAHIPEDRQRSGMIGEFDHRREHGARQLLRRTLSRTASRMDWPAVHKVCVKNVIDFDVRTPSIYSLADHLSGGNQQKLIVARELSRDVKLVIASQPTRGLDVGSIEYIHGRIIEARDEGVGVLIVSTELDEILALSDRILVMFRGRIVAEFAAGEADVARDRPGDGGSGAVTDARRDTDRRPRACCSAPSAARFDIEDIVRRAGARGDRGADPRRLHHAARPGVSPEAIGKTYAVAVQRLGRLGLRALRDADGGGAADPRRPRRWRSASAPACSTSAPRAR